MPSPFHTLRDLRAAAVPRLPGRAEEVRRLNSMSAEELADAAGPRLTIVPDLDDLHAHFAQSLLVAVRSCNRAGRAPAFILPWGPVDQYPIVSRLLSERRISLRDSQLFFMDEYADEAGKALPPTHPLSFRGRVERWMGSIDRDLRPLPENVVFPDETNADSIVRRIADAGGIEACFGGIGVHGHIAFNEPQAGVAESGVRLVGLNEFTRTINAIRAGVGGDLENFPRHAWTLGLRQCLSARRISLYCRSDCGLDWAKTVLRLALLGRPGDDYPVTWIRDHPAYEIVTDRATADPPAVIPV